MNVKIGRIKMRLLAAKLAQNPKKWHLCQFSLFQTVDISRQRPQSDLNLIVRRRKRYESHQQEFIDQNNFTF